MKTTRTERLEAKKATIVAGLPPLGEMVRGSFIERYLECSVKRNCRCHQDKKYRHGPHYQISYGKGKHVHHIYVPAEWKDKAKEWTDNYNKIWKAMEQISEINIVLMKKRAR